MHDPKADMALLCQAAEAAGDIAQQYFKSDPKVWDKDNNAGPVTEADLAVNDMLQSTLRAARPGYGWLSEETEDTPDRLSQDTTFIIDPIDGTRAFIEGSAHWSHSLAIAHGGQVTAAAVYLPVTQMLFAASIGGGATLNGTPIKVGTREQTEGACVLAAKANFKDEYWPGGFPGIRRSFRSSLAYRLCLVAEGAFDGMLTLRGTWEWDVAAGALIVTEAGGVVSDQKGGAPCFNQPGCMIDGMVAANPAIHADLIRGLTPPA